jgi:hypothetical protein
MNLLIAACGLDCGQCPAYLATQANDEVALERVAAEWRAEYNAPNITMQSVICDSCMVGERHCGHCSECDIRKCVVEHGLVNCAYCDDYACDRLQGFFKMVPQVQSTLDAIRAQG